MTSPRVPGEETQRDRSSRSHPRKRKGGVLLDLDKLDQRRRHPFVRLLGRYLNSRTEVERILRLCKRAASEHTVRLYRPTKRGPVKLSAEDNVRIMRLYTEGWRPVDIAAEVGTSEWSVHNRLNHMGVARRPKGFSRDQQDEIVNRYLAGESMRQIGISFKRDAKTIRQALNDNHVTLRSVPTK